MSSSNLIGLFGVAGSGKSTAAAVLWTEGYISVSFAQPIKDMINSLNLFDESHWDDRDLKEKVIEDLGCSPRHLAVTLGTEWGRKMIREDIWILLAKRRISRLLEQGYKVVVEDGRFQNEAEAIEELGGYTVKIERKGHSSTADANHSSESGIKSLHCQGRIVNEGTLAEYENTVRWYFNHPSRSVADLMMHMKNQNPT